MGTFSLLTPTGDPTEPALFLRHCPHCGSPRLGAGGDKFMRCPDCGFDWYLNAAAATVALISDARGRLLLTRRARDPWAGSLDLPGGFVDPGEGIEEALEREIEEELGVRVTQRHYFASFPNEYVYGGYKIRTCDVAFVCHTDRPPTEAHDDAAELLYLAPGEIRPEEIHLASIRHFVERWLEAGNREQGMRVAGNKEQVTGVDKGFWRVKR